METVRLVRWGAGPAWLFVLLWWETLAPFLPLFQPGWRGRARHGLRNITLSLINTGLTALLFAGLWASAADWAADRCWGALNGLSGWPAGHALGALVALDLWTYWWHRLNHRLPVLWRFHRAHHSDAQVDVTTASRFHLGEILLSDCLRILVIVLIGIRLKELVIYETVLLTVVQFHHANIGLPAGWDRLLRCLIVTPAMHKVHHSRVPVETDSNYSSVCSVWDRLFRSLRLRHDPHVIQFGLEDFSKPGDQTLAGILKAPLARRSSTVS